MKNLLFFILFCAFFYNSCSSPKRPINFSEPVVINITDALSHKKAYVLSDILDSIEYLYPKLHISSPVMDIGITDQYIVIYDGLDRLLCFDRKGNLLHQIGRRGKGPKEYLRITDFSLDELKNRIYALCESNFLYIYNFQGNFIKRIPAGKNVDIIGFISPGSFLLHHANWFADTKERYSVVNEAGELIKQYKYNFSYILNKRYAWGKEAVKYTFNNQLHIKDKGDTLYIVTKDKLIPKYVFKSEYSVENGESNQVNYDKITFWTAFETEHRLYFSIFMDREKYHFYYDKLEDKTYSYQKKTKNPYEEIENDMDDKTQYYLGHQHNEILLSPRIDFDFDQMTGLSSDKRDKIEKNRSSIDDEDPFIIAIMYLKNQEYASKDSNCCFN